MIPESDVQAPSTSCSSRRNEWAPAPASHGRLRATSCSTWWCIFSQSGMWTTALDSRRRLLTTYTGSSVLRFAHLRVLPSVLAYEAVFALMGRPHAAVSMPSSRFELVGVPACTPSAIRMACRSAGFPRGRIRPRVAACRSGHTRNQADARDVPNDVPGTGVGWGHGPGHAWRASASSSRWRSIWATVKVVGDLVPVVGETARRNRHGEARTYSRAASR